MLQDEPGEWVWTFRRTDDEVAIDVRLLDGSSSQGRHVVDARTTLIELAGQVSGESSRLLRDLGEDGYLELWKLHPFPATSHERLSEWVAANAS